MIYRGRVFDGTDIHENAEISIDQVSGTIEYLDDLRGSGGKRSSKDMTFLPGLIDTHIHFFGSPNRSISEWTLTPDIIIAVRSVYGARNLLQAGFTTVRTMGDKVSIGLSKAESDGILDGPRIISSGFSIAQTGGNDDPKFLPYNDSTKMSYSYYCDGPWDCRKAVRLNVRNGAESIKAYSSSSFVGGGDIRDELTVEELSAIADEAHKSHLRAASHAYGVSAIHNSLVSGFDSIEHGLGLNEEIGEEMVKNKAFYVPTISIYKSLRKDSNETRNAMIRNHIEKEVKLANDLGIRIAMGTDFLGTSDTPHGSNWLEINNLSEVIGNENAIMASTSIAAECLGLEGVGKINEGFRGDVIAVKGDPLKDVKRLNPENIVLVIKKGKKVKG
ncbi:MAG: amidohydrolase family protein [Thermoplasmatales archaeon]